MLIRPLLLLALLPCFAQAQSGELIANVGCSSGVAINGQTIPDFEAWAKIAGPIFKSRGIKRVTLHNPSGIGTAAAGDIKTWRIMRPDQWLHGERHGRSYADRKKFAVMLKILKAHGVTEVIVYIGSPALLKHPEVELPRCVQPFLEHPDSDVVSFCFDYMFYDGYEYPKDDPRRDEWRKLWATDAPCTRAVANLRLHCYRIYAEPRLFQEQVDAGLAKLIDGTMATAEYDAIPNLAHLNLLAIQEGEIIRRTLKSNKTCTWGDEIKDWPDNVTPWLMSGCNWWTGMNKVPVEEFFQVGAK